MIKSVSDHLWKIKQEEEELSKCKPGTPHYNDIRKHLFRLNKQLLEYKKYARD